MAKNLQTKTVSPLKAGQTVTPDGGYSGLSKVTLTALPDLTPENIPLGITIGAVTGTAKVSVSDETPEDFVSPDPNYPEPGTVEDADLTYRTLTGGDHTGDKLILADNNGNITYGYLDDPAVDTVQYGRMDLPDAESVRKENRPYAFIYHNNLDPNIFLLVCGSSQPYITVSDGKLKTKADTCEGYRCTPGEIRSDTPKGDKVWTHASTNTNKDCTWGYATNLIWSDHDIYDDNGTLYYKAIPPVKHLSGGFTITRYDPLTMEFAAKGWRRLSYHVDTGEWLYDDFTTTPSTGWNYLSNLRACTRSDLTYRSLPVWPKTGTRVESFSADMTAWTKNGPAAKAFTAITYDGTNDENLCRYTGAGMFEYIGFPVQLTAGRTYAFVMDYRCPAGVTGQYAPPYAPYIGFFPTAVLSSDAEAYPTAYASRRLPVEAVEEYQRYVCTYTPVVSMTVAVTIGLGSTLDGVDTEFGFRNLSLWELPEESEEE